ncbi:PQQ-dependent sugar dehydrogenase [Candidatus Microgenomates bacterium]|nr:PQQ-dependent sugar dehydrogenase [Candidatus Microgenomates bacterium]
MKKILLSLLVILIMVVTFLFWTNNKSGNNQEVAKFDSPAKISTSSVPTETPTDRIKIIAQNLDTPWALVFLPQGEMLITERPGRVRLLDKNGLLDPTPVATLESVNEIGEGGLLGMALHPDFNNNHYVYLYYTYSSNGDNTLNRVVRMTFQDKKLTDEKILIDKIPGAANHNGGRIKFGPDKLLYITTGDAQVPSQAQDTTSLAGKILRVTDEGQKAPGNPFGNLVYSYGHRNPQGIVWNQLGQLWSTEHGRSGIPSGLDEINLIEPGKNYGWPTIQGEESREGMVRPVANSGSNTWAPAGAAFVNNYLFFAGLRGQRLYRAAIENKTVQNLEEYFTNQYGRLREVIFGPDGMLYVTTSNQDGRGLPRKEDDRILKIDPKQL